MAARQAILGVCVISVFTSLFISSMFRVQLKDFLQTQEKWVVTGNARRPPAIYVPTRKPIHVPRKPVLPTKPMLHRKPVLPTKPVPQMDYEVVISHYKEKLDWLKPVANYCHVYDKGHDVGLKPPFGIKQWEEQLNVGRESYTYLYHIINNYDHLANITIFLQGKIGDHAPAFCFRTPLEFLAKARKGIPCVVIGKVGWGKVNHIAKWKKEYDRGIMRHAKNRTVGEFYRTVFEKAPPPHPVDCCLAGCFSATRRCLHKHPKTFYQKLISFLDDHLNPEEGHYMERLWRTFIAC